MPIPRWKSLNRRIVRRKLRWEDIQEELLDILVELDALRRQGRIPEGQYRQKGNDFRDTVIALVRARCGIALKERMLYGKSDVFRVDLSYVLPSSDLKRSPILLAGEVKAIGSPEHRGKGWQYPERTVSIDIDKRIKEVKYISVDLKRRADPEVRLGWSHFIQKTLPAFFVAWLLRVSGRNNVNNIFKKLIGVTEYTNGVGMALYQESSSGRYEWISPLPPPLLSIGELVEAICHSLGRRRKSPRLPGRRRRPARSRQRPRPARPSRTTGFGGRLRY